MKWDGGESDTIMARTEFGRYLMKGSTVAIVDKLNFEKYACGQQSLERTFMNFKKNNHIDEEIHIDGFENWLRSLGYFR